MHNVPFQYELRPEIPNVFGALDYREFRETLIKIDEILNTSGLEHKIISQMLEQYAIDKGKNPGKFYNSKEAVFHYKIFRHALRCNISRHLTGESYRLFSIKLADSTLFQWFTNINALAQRKNISKSSLERYEKYFDEVMLGEKIREWLASLSDAAKAKESGIYQPVNCKNTFTDSTCVKANIHFPVDWVLLRDAVKSLVLAIKTIRAHGLKHRMIEPQLFLKQMNKLCICMTHTRRKADSKKQRKIIFRAMKKINFCLAKHGKRYRELLSNDWQKTDLSYAQAQQIIRRVDTILEQLPTAIKQAHERIIGERIVPNEEKILSFYDKDAHVIVRGKAGNEVEFGQGLLLTEQTDGLIIDWQLFAEQPPCDGKLLKPTLILLKKCYGAIGSSCADRAFSTKQNDIFLREHKIYNAVCP
jgi:hypothetical protein